MYLLDFSGIYDLKTGKASKLLVGKNIPFKPSVLQTSRKLYSCGGIDKRERKTRTSDISSLSIILDREFFFLPLSITETMLP